MPKLVCYDCKVEYKIEKTGARQIAILRPVIKIEPLTPLPDDLNIRELRDDYLRKVCAGFAAPFAYLKR